MFQDSDVLSLLATRRPNHSLPRAFYTDPDILRLDLERIFYRSWLFAVPACEIPKAGNYVTYKVGLYSVIIVRGADGVVRAFHNTCRHRGSTLCRARRARPEDRLPLPPVDLRARRPAALRARHGRGLRRLAARPDPGPLPRRERARLHLPRRRGAGLRRLRRRGLPLPRAARPLELQDRLREHHRRERQLEARLGEQPRVLPLRRQPPVAHPHLPRGSAPLRRVGGQGPSPCSTGTSPGANSQARPPPSRSTRRGRWRFVRMPLLGTAESYTMDGKAAVAKPNSTLPFRDAGALLLFNYPSTWNHFLADHAICSA